MDGAKPPGLKELADAIVAADPTLTEADRAIVLTLYRLLAEGRPVRPAELTRRARVDRQRVTAALERWPGVFRDDEGRVIGFWGLALGAMSHRLRVSGVELYAWCAWDPLFIGPLLDRPVEVESRCPVTGTIIRLTVTPEGVTRLRPATAIMSFLAPDRCWDDDVITTFCHYVLFFASEEAGWEWTAARQHTFLLSIADGFELGRRVNEARFGLTPVAPS